MSEYAYTTAPINTKALGIGGYKRTIFALHSGGMTIHEIAREFELKPSEVRRVIVDVWATDSSELKAEKELAYLNRLHAASTKKRKAIRLEWKLSKHTSDGTLLFDED